MAALSLLVAIASGMGLAHAQDIGYPAKCTIKGYLYLPHNMPLMNKSIELDWTWCQLRCKHTPPCAYFGYWPDHGCHLQGETAQTTVNGKKVTKPVELTKAICFDGSTNCSGTQVISGPLSCEDERLFPDTSGGDVTPVKVTHHVPDGCLIKGYVYSPEDMESVFKSVEVNWQACQRRCETHAFCEHFSYWPDGGCHIQGNGVSLMKATCVDGDPNCKAGEVISGPNNCDNKLLYPDTSGGDITAVTTGCTVEGYYYTPIDMESVFKTYEMSWQACQKRCETHAYCEHFSFWPDNGCHIQGYNVSLVKAKCSDGGSDCSGKKVRSGPATCEDPTKFPDTSGGDLTPAQIGCTIRGYKYSPLNMESVFKTYEEKWQACQRRCATHAYCEHFSYWPDGGCHIQGNNVSLVKLKCANNSTDCDDSKVISGPADCSFDDKFPDNSGGDVTPVYDGCTVKGYMYLPHNMKFTFKTYEANWRACQRRCATHVYCEHFSFWPDFGCHIQGNNVSLVKAQCFGGESVCEGMEVITGPKTCENVKTYPQTNTIAPPAVVLPEPVTTKPPPTTVQITTVAPATTVEITTEAPTTEAPTTVEITTAAPPTTVEITTAAPPTTVEVTTMPVTTVQPTPAPTPAPITTVEVTTMAPPTTVELTTVTLPTLPPVTTQPQVTTQVIRDVQPTTPTMAPVLTMPPLPGAVSQIELHYDMDFNQVDQAKFKSGFIDGLKKLGASDDVISKLDVSLRAGSVIATIKGPTALIGVLKGLLLSNLEVMGVKPKTVDMGEDNDETKLPQLPPIENGGAVEGKSNDVVEEKSGGGMPTWIWIVGLIAISGALGGIMYATGMCPTRGQNEEESLLEDEEDDEESA